MAERARHALAPEIEQFREIMGQDCACPEKGFDENLCTFRVHESSIESPFQFCFTVAAVIRTMIFSRFTFQ
jgi:hypothetical protein